MNWKWSTGHRAPNTPFFAFIFHVCTLLSTFIFYYTIEFSSISNETYKSQFKTFHILTTLCITNTNSQTHSKRPLWAFVRHFTYALCPDVIFFLAHFFLTPFFRILFSFWDAFFQSIPHLGSYVNETNKHL